MEYRRYIIMLSLLTLAMAVRAQVVEDGKRLQKPDSLKNDYEEWLRNEPLRPKQDSLAIQPMPPITPVTDPRELHPKHPPISINIMTPQLRTEMQLAYHSHWLEEQQKMRDGAQLVSANIPERTVENAATEEATQDMATVQSSKSKKSSRRGQRTSSTYRVKSGDTLSKIAQRHGTTVSKLCKLNGIKQNAVLRKGQVLRCS